MKKSTPWWRRILDTLTSTPATTTTAKPSTPKTSKTEPYVYVTKSGKKFHYDQDCPTLQSAWSRNEVFKMDLPKARAAGRTACSKCCYDYLRE